jgi:CheY-like chemotaxis protein
MNKKVLIVDDCATTRKLLSYIIRERGYEIFGAANGIEALEMLAINDVDLVVTDLNMPQMDGLELSKNLRSDDNNRGLEYRQEARYGCRGHHVPDQADLSAAAGLRDREGHKIV